MRRLSLMMSWGVLHSVRLPLNPLYNLEVFFLDSNRFSDIYTYKSVSRALYEVPETHVLNTVSISKTMYFSILWMNIEVTRLSHLSFWCISVSLWPDELVTGPLYANSFLSGVRALNMIILYPFINKYRPSGGVWALAISAELSLRENTNTGCSVQLTKIEGTQ